MSRGKRDYEDHCIRMDGLDEWLDERHPEPTSEELETEFQRFIEITNRKRGS